jgi:hypothetical protein
VPVNYIVLAIPVFLVLIALELVITRLQERQYYSLGDTISDIGTGSIGCGRPASWAWTSSTTGSTG